MSPILLIPAYRPAAMLPALLRDAFHPPIAHVLLIDDGSGPEYAPVFDACRPFATVLTHPANRGKGAALKTGLAHAAAHFPAAPVVTADADGQHLPADILRVARRLAQPGPPALILGTRQFDGHAPLRSRLGNRAACLFTRLLIGQNLADTQTGLRGIPPPLLPPLARIPYDGYEFELDMLHAAVHHQIPIAELPIATVYEPGNPTSHFRPLRDSLRIGFVLARFSLLSLATAALDNAVFLLATSAAAPVHTAQILARLASVLFQYPLARSAVFHSHRPHEATLTRYLALVAVSGFASYHLLNALHHYAGLPIPAAKITAETALFFVNFAVQRALIFTQPKPAK